VCPICGKTAYIQYADLYDDRYGFPDTFGLHHCPSCGHRYIAGSFEPDFLRKLYTDYYPRSSYDLAAHRPHQAIGKLKAWLTGARALAFRWVPKDVRVLDIGCGFGETLGYHRARGCDVYGVEADENILRVAERCGYNVHAGLFDPSLYEADFFDYVTMDQVIEHVNDPVETLRGVEKVLKPGGTLVLSTPNAEGLGARILGHRWVNWHIPYHQHFFSRASMLAAAEKAGLELSSSRSITHAAWLYYQWVHLLTRPDPGIASSFWSPGARNSISTKICIKLLRLTHYSLFNHIVARIVDVFGRGDNRIFILRKKLSL